MNFPYNALLGYGQAGYGQLPLGLAAGSWPLMQPPTFPFMHNMPPMAVPSSMATSNAFSQAASALMQIGINSLTSQASYFGSQQAASAASMLMGTLGHATVTSTSQKPVPQIEPCLTSPPFRQGGTFDQRRLCRPEPQIEPRATGPPLRHGKYSDQRSQGGQPHRGSRHNHTAPKRYHQHNNRDGHTRNSRYSNNGPKSRYNYHNRHRHHQRNQNRRSTNHRQPSNNNDQLVHRDQQGQYEEVPMDLEGVDYDDLPEGYEDGLPNLG